MLKQKKAQVFGMGFGVIFSIILIIFILVVTGIAIRHFLNLKKCAQIGMFIEDLESDIADARSSGRFADDLSYVLPNSLDYVCFANLSNNPRGGEIESEIYYDISVYSPNSGNMFFHPRENACNMPYVNIKHIDIEKITSSRNPYCFKIENGKIIINIEQGFNEGLVNLYE